MEDIEVIIESPEETIIVEITPGGENINTTSEYILSVTAGQDLSGGRLVYITGGIARYFNPNDLSLYGKATGITKSAAMNGLPVLVQIDGVLYESGFGLSLGALYYAGINGTLTVDPSGLQIVQIVGNSIDENRLNININSQPTITL